MDEMGDIFEDNARGKHSAVFILNYHSIIMSKEKICFWVFAFVFLLFGFISSVKQKDTDDF